MNHRAAAQSVGLDKTTVLIYGNPNGTTLLMATSDFALELSLCVLVREDDRGQAFVTLNPMTNEESKNGLPAGMAEKLAPAQKLITAEVMAPSDA